MEKLPKNLQKDQKGIAAILTVIIISAATLIMAFNSSLLGLGELELGYTSQKSGEAMAVADSCVEESLRRLRLDSSYAGGVLNVNSDSCVINIVVAGANRTIVAESTVGEYHKKIQVEATLSGRDVTVNSWQELDN
ncbi:MAG: hypothetical protein KAI72_04670 [Candidatus Pacebacteria bacterium]|nr:hypothetical protein [Candidatus Paceibacterota bacterium]